MGVGVTTDADTAISPEYESELMGYSEGPAKTGAPEQSSTSRVKVGGLPIGVHVSGGAIDGEDGGSGVGFGSATCMLNGLYEQGIGPAAWSCAGAAGLGAEACFAVFWSDFCVSGAGAAASSFGVGVVGKDGACDTSAAATASDADVDADADAKSGLLPMGIPACLSAVGAVASGVCATMTAQATSHSLGGDSAADGEGQTADCEDAEDPPVLTYCAETLKCLIKEIEDSIGTIQVLGQMTEETVNTRYIDSGAPYGSGCFESWNGPASRVKLVDVLSPPEQDILFENLKFAMLENLRSNKPVLSMGLANTLAPEYGDLDAAQLMIDQMWLDFEPAIEEIVDNAPRAEMVGYIHHC